MKLRLPTERTRAVEASVIVYTRAPCGALFRFHSLLVTDMLRSLLFRFLLIGLLLPASPATADLELRVIDDFTLTAIDGASHSLSDYRGKWVVVNYWATWCPPCLEELPELVLFHETHHATNAVVLGINMEQLDTEVLAEFVDSYAIDYPVLQVTREIDGLDPVTALPTSFLIDPEGRLVARKVGQVSMQGIEAFIDNWNSSGVHSD